MQRILILGAGTAGTMMANRLVKVLPASWRVTVLDRDDEHVYQPGLLFLPFGMYRDDELTRPRHRTVDPRVELRLAEIDRIDPAARTVSLLGGERIAYDWLIVATGSRILPESTPGLTGVGWRDTAFDFYTLDGARALREKLDRFTGGRLVVNVVEMPIKCPVAPLEFLFLAEAFFTERGMRDKVEIVYATPLEGAFTKPVASAHLGGMLARARHRVVGDFAIAEVDGAAASLKAYDGREEPYDLLVTIPIHGGAEVITDSKLGDGGGWMPTDKHTLAARGLDRVFAIGDATDLPSSKAGAVAHFQSDVPGRERAARVAARPLVPEFDGHANCFIETGHGKAMLIDFNYTTEPLPGRSRCPASGPSPCSRRAR
jgi:sulfide:quinone oxidoreductase